MSEKKDSSRNLDPRDSMILYGLSAGRCNICNQSIVRHPLLKTIGNMGHRAHIVDHAKNGGARTAADLEAVDLEKFAFRVIDSKKWDTAGLDNIVLLCHACHWNADKNEPQEWPIEQLMEFKRHHEERILSQTEANKRTFVVEYTSMIGKFNPKSSKQNLRKALTSTKRFEEGRAILGDSNRVFADHELEFWDLETKTLEKHYYRRVEEVKEGADYEHFSIFAMASQALLIKLGTLLGSKDGSLVFPCNRDENHPWGWYESEPHKFLLIDEGGSAGAVPVLFLRVSGSQSTSDRAVIEHILGASDLAVYILELDGELKPGIEWHPDDNDSFRKKALEVLNLIHEKHGRKQIHVFPALPNHLAVEFGRSSLEKAHPPLVVYDYTAGRWMEALRIDR